MSLKITILCTSCNNPNRPHYDPDWPPLLEIDDSDFSKPAILSQTFEDVKLHPVGVISRQLAVGEVNYDVYDKELLPIVCSLWKWTDIVQCAHHKTIVYMNHQNLSYFKNAVSLNRRQATWAEDLQSYDFDLFYRKGSSISRSIHCHGAQRSPQRKGVQQQPDNSRC